MEGGGLHLDLLAARACSPARPPAFARSLTRSPLTCSENRSRHRHSPYIRSLARARALSSLAWVGLTLPPYLTRRRRGGGLGSADYVGQPKALFSLFSWSDFLECLPSWFRSAFRGVTASLVPSRRYNARVRNIGGREPHFGGCRLMFGAGKL